MLVRILDGISAFFDYLTAVHPLPVAFAVLAQLAKLSCTSLAWRNVLVAAYPETPIRRRSILGAYLAGVGVNALIPLRAGDAVRVVLAHRAVARSTYTTIVSSTFVLMRRRCPCTARRSSARRRRSPSVRAACRPGATGTR